mgnify:CR=1 FL=1
MGLDLNRRNLSAIAKLDFNGRTHRQRLDLIARAIGFESQAAMMGKLKHAETPALLEPAGENQSVLQRMGITEHRAWEKSLFRTGIHFFAGPIDGAARRIMMACKDHLYEHNFHLAFVCPVISSQTAAAAVEIALDGHPVLVEMHSGSPRGALNRMLGLGIGMETLKRIARGAITARQVTSSAGAFMISECAVWERPEQVGDPAYDVTGATLAEDMMRLVRGGLISFEAASEFVNLRRFSDEIGPSF